MELWIRSQDKNGLEKVDNGVIVVSCTVRKVFADQKMFVDLGTYKSHERALKVLEEIQSYLETINDVSQMVYVMPKE